ncbi:MAG: hypothetical protein QJR01_05555 [Kyrpidia sp.]|nr:hypothetical protein [Kyrpidia sp.]
MQLSLTEVMVVGALFFVLVLAFQVFFMLQLPPAKQRNGRSTAPGHPRDHP